MKKHKFIFNSKVTSFASISSTTSSPFKMSYMNTGVLSRDEEIKKSRRRSRKAFHYKNKDYKDFEDEYERMKEQKHENKINQLSKRSLVQAQSKHQDKGYKEIQLEESCLNTRVAHQLEIILDSHHHLNL